MFALGGMPRNGSEELPLVGFPDLQLRTQELLAEGDQVVARFTCGSPAAGWRSSEAPPTGWAC